MKKLLRFLKGYYKESILAPTFKMLEAIFELLVPVAVAIIIDDGINGGDTKKNMAYVRIYAASCYNRPCLRGLRPIFCG